MTDVDLHDMTPVERAQLVRTMVRPIDLVAMFDGLECVRAKIRSPFNDADSTPSCHLYDDHYFDYSTGRHGDVIDLYMALTGATWGRALDRLLSGAHRLEADPGRVRRTDDTPADLTDTWRAEPELDGRDIAVWADRLPGVSHGVLEDLAIADSIRGDSQELLVAHWHGTVVRGIKVRNAITGKTSFPGSQFRHGLYWPFMTPLRSYGRLVITEGETDAWALADALPDTDIASLPSGAGLWRPDWLDSLNNYEVISTCFDNDRAGYAATEKVRSSIGWGRWAELRVPDLFNDVREARAAGWTPT